MSEPVPILLVQAHAVSAHAISANLCAGASPDIILECVDTLEQALEVLEKQRIAAILLDLELPGTHELDAFITLHLRAPEIPILVFAETVLPERGLDAVRAGAQDCLTRAEVESPLLGRALGYAMERQHIRAATHSHTERLQFSEARFRLLINENADAIIVVNVVGTIRFANPAAAVLFGKTREELVGSTFAVELNEDAKTIQIERGRETAVAQLRVVATLWNRENVFLVTLRDMTELQRAEQQEKHQRELAQALADSAAMMNSTLSYAQVLDRILENVERVVPHDAASIFLIQGEEARMARGHGFVERGLGQWMDEVRLPFTRVRHFQKMIETGHAVVIPATQTDAGWLKLDNEWIESFVGAPLRVREQVVGFLNVDSATRNFYTAQHAADLQAFADQAATALENARLHADAQRRADEFALLYDFTRELGMQRDLDTMLETLVERAMKLLNAPCGGLSLYLPATQELEARVVRGEPAVLLGSKIKVGEGLVGRVALAREPLIIQDYRTWEHRLAIFDVREISAVLSVPMLYGGELVGVLSVRERGDSTRRYSHADAQLLMLLATQAAALVYNARLHEETEMRAQQMGLLYDAGLALNSELEPARQLDFLTQIAMRSVHAERAVFFRMEEETRALQIEFALGYAPDKPFAYPARISLDNPRGIEAWVARTRLPVTLNDAPNDPRFVMTQEELYSGIWVPVEHDQQLLGILGVGSTRRNAFTADDERLLILYASQAAIALENGRLYQSALQANERRAVLHWASQEIIRAGLDAERVYAAIHQAVARLMPCEAFVIAVLDETAEWIELPYLYDRGGRQPSGQISKTRGLSGHMLTTGSALLIDHLGSSGLDTINFGYPVQVASLLAVPLRHGGQVFGMLSTQSYRRGVYNTDDQVMLEMLAAHAAAALMNVRGAEEIQRGAETNRRGAEENLQALERAYLETALALAKAIDTRDTYTGAHSERIAVLAQEVARKMELSEEETQAIYLGARLHDIGKIGVPDEILRKPSALTETEWALMKRHPEIGADILALVRPLQNVAPIVKYHQEHFDGGGYPAGLKGEAIPLGARILAVVDAFSAMTDDRAYRKGRSAQEALDELRRCAGTQFDPHIVEMFLQVAVK